MMGNKKRKRKTEWITKTKQNLSTQYWCDWRLFGRNGHTIFSWFSLLTKILPSSHRHCIVYTLYARIYVLNRTEALANDVKLPLCTPCPTHFLFTTETFVVFFNFYYILTRLSLSLTIFLSLCVSFVFVPFGAAFCVRCVALVLVVAKRYFKPVFCITQISHSQSAIQFAMLGD